MALQNETGKENKRNRPVPLLIWFTGAVLTGGLITFAVLSYQRGEIITDLNFRMSENESNYNREKNELNDKLNKNAVAYNDLATRHEASIASLGAEQAKNQKLAKSNANYVLRESQLMKELSFWQDSTNRLGSAYSSLLAENSILKSVIRDLEARIAAIEKDKAEQAGNSDIFLDELKRLKADSMMMAAYRDSVMKENVSGFYNNTYATGAYGLKDISLPYSKYFFGASTINGYVINRHFMTGIGLGIQSYNDGGLMSPVFLDLRYTLGKKNFQPYFFADGGMLINYDDIEVPGVFINPGVGFMQKLGDHFSFNFGAGYYLQKDGIRHSFVNAQVGIVYRKK